MKELPELPNGWCWSSIKDISLLVTDGDHNPPKRVTSGVPHLTAKNIRNWSINFDGCSFLSEEGFEQTRKRYEPKPGDVIVTCVGTVGEIAVVPEGILFSADRNLAAIRVPPNCIDSKFVLYALSSPFLRDRIQGASGSTAQPHLYLSDLRAMPAPLPPLNEQRRIVAKLESLLARSRRAKEALSAIPPLLEKFRQSVLAAAFRGDLTAEWRAKNPDVEPASELLVRIRQERRKRWEEAELEKMRAKGKTPKDDKWKEKYEEPAPISSENLPKIPPSWCWATLETIAALKGGIMKGKKRSPGEVLRSVPYLRVANVQRGFLDLKEILLIEATESEIEDTKLKKGDILFNEGGDRDKLGRGWIWNDEIPCCVHQNHVFRARLYSEKIKPEIISFYSNEQGQSYFLEKAKQTTNLASISLGKLANLPVPIIPEGEQKELARIVELQLSNIKKQISIIQEAQISEERLETAILSKAFRGELVPQDPADEPAEALLARIRAEREATQPRKSTRGRAKKTTAKATPQLPASSLPQDAPPAPVVQPRPNPSPALQAPARISPAPFALSSPTPQPKRRGRPKKR